MFVCYLTIKPKQAIPILPQGFQRHPVAFSLIKKRHSERSRIIMSCVCARGLVLDTTPVFQPKLECVASILIYG